MAASSKLYPPIINYAMPAFAYGQQTVRIYFALPSYNSIGDIRAVQLTVRYQESNENALASRYLARIKAIEGFGSLDIERATQSDKYYIELNRNDLAQGFEADRIYKIQLRFSSIYNNPTPTAGWINDNYLSFSEWSTVCLLKPIVQPSCDILGLEGADSGATVSYTSTDASFAIVYDQGASQELLKSWRTILYDETGTIILANSGWNNYTNYDYLPVAENKVVAFESLLPYIMVANVKYQLQLDIITRNGYTLNKLYKFTCYPILSDDFIGNISVGIDEEEGYAKVTVTTIDPYSTNIVIRRSSSESNFKIWEDVALKTTLNEVLNWTIKDFTIESGIWYQYGVQTRDTNGRRGSLTVKSNIIMGEFENAFLLEEGPRQLKLKYDFNISTANINVAENKTDTIGSKFPFVRRNGTMYYRTFQCTGLITGYMDEDNLFTSKEELYHGEQDRYNNIRAIVDHRVNSYDYTYEREFREKVQEFLYNDKIKLFKSLQEGNILVKLMNISLTPKNELGRLIYSFSAQAIEIDEPTLVNLQLYNIQPIQHYASSITFSSEQLGQLSNFIGYEKNDEGAITEINGYFEANQNLVHLIAKKYGWVYDGDALIKNPRNNIIVNDFKIHYLRFELESEPYLIYKSGNQIIPYVNTDYAGTAAGTTSIDGELILGWIIILSIKGEETTLLVQPPNNIYELAVNNLEFEANTNIYFPVDTLATVYYTTSLNESYDSASNVPISLKYNTIIGQLYRNFNPEIVEDDIVRILTKKYIYTDKTGTSRKEYTMNQLIWADIEAEPGTILYAKSSATLNAAPTQFIINENGNLLLEPNVENSKIEILYFAGKQLDIRYLYPAYMNSFPKYTQNRDSDYAEFNQDAVARFAAQHNRGNSKPIDPKTYDYYYENNQYYMYYERDWYKCTRPLDYIWEIRCPVTAIVNYQVQQLEGVYQ